MTRPIIAPSRLIQLTYEGEPLPVWPGWLTTGAQRARIERALGVRLPKIQACLDVYAMGDDARSWLHHHSRGDSTFHETSVLRCLMHRWNIESFMRDDRRDAPAVSFPSGVFPHIPLKWFCGEAWRHSHRVPPGLGLSLTLARFATRKRASYVSATVDDHSLQTPIVNGWVQHDLRRMVEAAVVELDVATEAYDPRATP